MNTLFLAMALSVSAPAPDTVVVCAPAFEAALQPWLEYRRSQGHAITLVSNAGGAADIRARIRRHATGGRLRHVLLIGDAPIPAGERYRVPLLGTSIVSSSSISDANRIPAHYVPSKVTLRWGSEPLIASDNYYADLDDDQSPDLAIGRLTADAPAELTAMIEKINSYERNSDFGPWRMRINFVAGTGGFGAMADKVLERVAANLIAAHVPATYESSMTYASWQSPFCPHPRRFQESAIERLNEGCAFWVYIGHGSERTLAGVSLSPEFRWDSIFSARDVHRLKPAGGPSIALFLACRTGGYDKRSDCLAEELLRSPQGPVAVIGGSRVTMPHAMTVLGLGMMTETFENRQPTIGDAVLQAKRRLLPPASAKRVGLATVVAVSKAFEILPADLIPLSTRLAALRLLRVVGTLPADLMQERAEHVALFNLFGDPLLRLHHPKAIDINAPRDATAGQDVVVSGNIRSRAASSDGAYARIELTLPRDRAVREQPARHTYDASASALSAYDATYARANDAVLAAVSTPVRDGRFRASVRLPAACSGRYDVRVVVESKSYSAAAASAINIEPPTSRPPLPAPASTARADSPAR